MSNIAAVEDAIIAKLLELLTVDDKSLVKDIGMVPGTWSQQTLRRVLQKAPAVYVGFINAVPIDAQELFVKARFDVFVITDHSKEEQRRRGFKNDIGAYEIVERIAPSLHKLNVSGIGSLSSEGIRNLFNDAIFDVGATVYAIRCSIDMSLQQYETSGLDDFETFSIDFDIPPFNQDEHDNWSQENYNNADPDAQDNIQLEQ